MRDTSTRLNYTPVDFDPFAEVPSKRFVPITQPQLEIWMACQLGGDEASRAFNESLSLRLEGPLNQAAFHQAWMELVKRHEALRISFTANGEQQCIDRKSVV